MFRFYVCLGCIILALPCSLLAQPKTSISHEVAPYFINEDVETNLMFRYLNLGRKIGSSNIEHCLKYIDSALALGENYGTTDQWIYAKINRAQLEGLYREIEKSEEILKEIPGLLHKTTNPRLHGLYYYTLGVVEKKKNNLDLAINHHRTAISYYEKAKDHYQQGKLLMNVGNYLHAAKGKTEESLIEYEKALKHLETAEEKRDINTCLRFMSAAYNSAGRHEEAIATLHQVVRISETLGDKQGLATSYYELGNIYINMKNQAKALEYYHLSNTYAEMIKDKRRLAQNYSNIGYVLLSEGNEIDSAIYYQEKALQISRELKMHKELVYFSVQLVQSYNWQGDFKKAYQLVTEQFFSPYIYQRPRLLAVSYGMYADLLSSAKDEVPEINQMSNRDSVINVYLDSLIYLEREAGDPSSLLRAWGVYYQIKEKTGDYKGAYEGYKNRTLLYDSIMALDKKAEIIRLETDFKYAKQQDSLKYINQLAQEQLENQQLLGQQQSQRIRLLNSESELRRLSLLHTEADLNLQKEQGENLQQMLTISRQEQQLKQASLDEATKENELQRLRLRQQWIMGLAILAGVIGLAAFLFYRNKNKQNRVKLELERQVSDAMLKSLHAQMNPHFIFNSLASVKSYIAGKEPKRATNYLNNFAALIRRILHSSQEGTITFEEELETIRVYLGLEQERFKDKFSFSVQWHSQLIANEVIVPALFLQPYVENAVWHGIMQLKGAGKIDVQVYDREQDLIIQVTDNGAGIDESQAKEHDLTRNKRKSYGMKLSQQRLAQFWGADTSVTLKNREGASGAVLTIVVPQQSIKYASQ